MNVYHALECTLEKPCNVDSRGEFESNLQVALHAIISFGLRQEASDVFQPLMGWK